MKKLVSLFMVFVLILGAFSVSALAETTAPTTLPSADLSGADAAQKDQIIAQFQAVGASENLINYISSIYELSEFSSAELENMTQMQNSLIVTDEYVQANITTISKFAEICDKMVQSYSAFTDADFTLLATVSNSTVEEIRIMFDAVYLMITPINDFLKPLYDLQQTDPNYYANFKNYLQMSNYISACQAYTNAEYLSTQEDTADSAVTLGSGSLKMIDPLQNYVDKNNITAKQNKYMKNALALTGTFTEPFRAYLVQNGLDTLTAELQEYTNIYSYTGQKIGSFKAVKKGKTKVKLTWKKLKNMSGYEIQYSKNNFLKSKKIVIKSKNKKTKTISKLKPGKYKVRIRSYKTIKGKKYYTKYKTAKFKITK